MLQRVMLSVVMFIMSFSSFAALDPIGWSLNHVFPDPISAEGHTQYSVTYTLRSQLSLTLIHPLRIDKKASSSEFSFTDGCSGLRLNPGETCTVTIVLNPVVEGPKTVQIAIAGYDNNIVPLPMLFTTVTGNNPTGPQIVLSSTSTVLPSHMSLTQTAPYEFTFINIGQGEATGVSVVGNLLNVGLLTFSSNCTTKLSANGGFCSASGTFQMTTIMPTTQGVVVTLTNNQTAPVIGETTTQVNSQGILGVVSPGLPNLTTESTSYPVIMTFTNYGPSSATLATSTFTSTCSGTTCGTLVNNCSTSTPLTVYPAAGSSCTMTTTYNSASPRSTTITGHVVSGSSSPTLTTSTTTQGTEPSNRTLTFTNNCPFPVAAELSGGATSQASPNCTSDSQCPLGAACNAGTGFCYWGNYAPTSPTTHTPTLNTGETVTITLPAPSGVSGVMWSGIVSGSTGCSTTAKNCLQADCNNNGGTTTCGVGKGFSQPATQVEFTLLTNGNDSYDLEVINGFHLPIEVYPTSTSGTGYQCTHNGAPTATDGFGACNWDNAVPPSPSSQYYWVNAGGTPTCTPGSCGSNQVCGLDNSLNQVCGDFSGYWTADQLCGVNPTIANAYFGCNIGIPTTPLPDGSSFPSGYTYTQLYQCKTPNAAEPLLNSCYPTGTVPLNDTCCGCVNWSQVYGIELPNDTILCGQNGTAIADPFWTGTSSIPVTTPPASTNPATQPYILQTIAWMKQACPSNYTFPYDDASSHFTCNNSLSSNSVGYTFVFCAGPTSGSSITGLPAGISPSADGRNARA